MLLKSFLFPSFHQSPTFNLVSCSNILLWTCFPPNNFWMCLATSDTSDRGKDGGERRLDFSNIIKIPEFSSKSVAGKRKRNPISIPSEGKCSLSPHFFTHWKKIHAGECHCKLWKKASARAFYSDRKSVKLKTQIGRK